MPTPAPIPCHANPCSSCPYRKDTPPGVWAREEYEKLPQYDAEFSMPGIFLRHYSTASASLSVCRGWLEVHCNNIGVRMAQVTGKIVVEDRTPTKFPLYDTGAEACRAGLRGICRPSKKALAMISKLLVRKEAKR